MRKIILLACLFLYNLVAIAQLTITGTHLPPIGKKNGKDSITVIIFDSITSNSLISYSGKNAMFYNFGDAISKRNPLSQINPIDATGYVVDLEGIRKDTIWVISYKNYLPHANSLNINDIQLDLCHETNLSINIPELFYKTLDNVSHTIPRNCNINYNTLKWGGVAWQDSIVNVPITFPIAQISVPSPFRNANFPTTTFTLSGDQYAKELKIDTFKITSPPYTPIAVICRITTDVTSRDQKPNPNNEGDVPNHLLPISFSAPIDVQFISNGNEPITQNYRWEIYKNPPSSPIVTRSEKDTRYTFTEFGTYKVKVTVSNATCSFSDSIKVDVSESAIYVPNVFTPNGDNFNDEFRVAFKSLISFQCWVYNRWGRQVYYWTDPTKGWDGNINGKKAVPGPYFYVIKATGSDKKVYKLRGDINLLRGVQN